MKYFSSVSILLLAQVSAYFVPASRNVRLHHSLSSYENHRASTIKRSAMAMFLEGFKSKSKQELVEDTAKLGILTVPSVGIGTISWSSDSRKFIYQDATYIH